MQEEKKEFFSRPLIYSIIRIDFTIDFIGFQFSTRSKVASRHCANVFFLFLLQVNNYLNFSLVSFIQVSNQQLFFSFSFALLLFLFLSLFPFLNKIFQIIFFKLSEAVFNFSYIKILIDELK